MQKVMYAVWRRDDEARSRFAIRLRTDVADGLLASPAVHGLRVNVVDDAVDAGNALVPKGLRRVATDPQMEAVISVWVDSATPYRFAPLADLMADAGSRVAGYLVLESEPLPTPVTEAPLDGRGSGFAQLAFIMRSADQEAATFRDRWLGDHTAVAVETQSTFGYRQNLVVYGLQDDGPDWAAIVEEDFHIEALTNRHAFYATGGDEQVLDEHRRRMSSSTRTFIDHASGLDVMVTSSYLRRDLRRS